MREYVACAGAPSVPGLVLSTCHEALYNILIAISVYGPPARWSPDIWILFEEMLVLITALLERLQACP